VIIQGIYSYSLFSLAFSPNSFLSFITFSLHPAFAVEVISLISVLALVVFSHSMLQINCCRKYHSYCSNTWSELGTFFQLCVDFGTGSELVTIFLDKYFPASDSACYVLSFLWFFGLEEMNLDLPMRSFSSW